MQSLLISQISPLLTRYLSTDILGCNVTSISRCQQQLTYNLTGIRGCQPQLTYAVVVMDSCTDFYHLLVQGLHHEISHTGNRTASWPQ